MFRSAFRPIPLSVFRYVIFVIGFIGLGLLTVFWYRPAPYPTAIWSLNGSHGIVSILPTSNKYEFIAACRDGTVRKVDISTRQSEIVFESANLASSIALSLQGKLCALVCEDRVVRLVNWESKSLVGEFQGGAYEVQSVAFAPDGKNLATCSWRDPFVRVWDIDSKQVNMTLDIDPKGASVVRYGHDGSCLFVGQSNGTVKCFETISGKSIAELNCHSKEVSDIAVLNSDEIASCGLDGTLCLWHVSTASLKDKMDFNHHLMTLCSDPSRTRLSVGDSYGNVHVVDLRTKKAIRFAAHNASLRCVYLVDRSHLLTACTWITLDDRITEGELATWFLPE